MTADREQVRRDAERFTDRDIADFTCHQGMSFVMAEDYDALLAELGQAERRIRTLGTELRDCENTLSETRP